MTLEEIMKLIGSKGFHVGVRYDPVRDKDNFTVMLGNKRLADTDEPVFELEKAFFGGQTYWKIEFMQNMFGNSKGEQVYIIQEDDDYIYYQDGLNRWCYVEKEGEGIVWKKVILK